MNSTNLSSEAIAEIESIVEQALSLKAAAAFKSKVSGIKMEQSRNAEGQRETINLAGEAQARENEAMTYSIEASRLFHQAREIAHLHGSSLPGLAGLRAISDNYSRRIARN